MLVDPKDSSNYIDIRRSIYKIQDVNEQAILRKNTVAQQTAESASNVLTMLFTILKMCIRDRMSTARASAPKRGKRKSFPRPRAPLPEIVLVVEFSFVFLTSATVRWRRMRGRMRRRM